MTEQQNDDASRGKRPPKGPEADPSVQGNAAPPVAALGADPDPEPGPEDDLEGGNELGSGFDALQEALDASTPSDHPTQSNPDAKSSGPDGS